MALPTLRSSYNTRKNVYEAAIIRKREKEQQMRDKCNSNEEFFKKADIRTKKEELWNSEKSFQQSMKAYLSQVDSDELNDDLLMRRSRLRNLLTTDSAHYEKELKKYNSFDSQENMNLRVNSHKQAKEIERCKLSDKLLDEHFRRNDPGLRSVNRELQTKQTIKSWGEQVSLKNEAIARELAEGLIQSENDSITRERADALERQAVEKQLTNDRERAIFLQKQIEELKQKELKAQALSREEEQLIQKKAFLSELEAEREARARKIEQRECGRALLRQHNAALRRRSRQVQDDLEADIRWLARLAEEVADAESAEQTKHQNVYQEAEATREHIEEELRRERIREAQLDEIYAKEAAQLWSQREGEWHREREARERLLSEVLAVRQKQIEACLEENRLRQAEDLHLRETLLADLESEVSGRSGGKALARHKAATQRRAELDAQLMEANLLQSREAEADRLETEAERAAEVEYEERLRYEANRLRRQHQQREASGKETSYNDYDNYADLSSLSLKDREGQELTEAVPYDSLICSGTRADKNYSTMRPLTGASQKQAHTIRQGYTGPSIEHNVIRNRLSAASRHP